MGLLLLCIPLIGIIGQTECHEDTHLEDASGCETEQKFPIHELSKTQHCRHDLHKVGIKRNVQIYL